MKFFFDNNIGQNVVKGFNEFGEDVLHLAQEFEINAKDEDWLPIVGNKGWILVTQDRRIRYNPAELKAYRVNSVGAFVLTGKQLNRCRIIQQLVRNWPKMKELANTTRRPFLFRIPPAGSKIKPVSI
jgi:predicted nuclease of predicted toxin-antitoxin system